MPGDKQRDGDPRYELPKSARQGRRRRLLGMRWVRLRGKAPVRAALRRHTPQTRLHAWRAGGPSATAHHAGQAHGSLSKEERRTTVSSTGRTSGCLGRAARRTARKGLYRRTCTTVVMRHATCSFWGASANATPGPMPPSLAPQALTAAHASCSGSQRTTRSCGSLGASCTRRW